MCTMLSCCVYIYIYTSVLTCCSVSISIEMDEGSCRPGFARIHCGEGPSACSTCAHGLRGLVTIFVTGIIMASSKSELRLFSARRRLQQQKSECQDIKHSLICGYLWHLWCQVLLLIEHTFVARESMKKDVSGMAHGIRIPWPKNRGATNAARTTHFWMEILWPGIWIPSSRNGRRVAASFVQRSSADSG